jgi:hypothetical protein
VIVTVILSASRHSRALNTRTRQARAVAVSIQKIVSKRMKQEKRTQTKYENGRMPEL